MAVQSAYVAAATTVAQNVTLNGPGLGITVVNLDGAGVVSFRIDGTTADLADENYFVAASAGAFRTVPVQRWPIVVSVHASHSTKVGIEVAHQ
jgi:hypothetical protein